VSTLALNCRERAEDALYLQIWAHPSSHPPFTAQGPRTQRFGASPGLAQRRLDKQVAFGPQQALELGHFVLLGVTAPSKR